MLLWKKVGNHFPVGRTAITPTCPPSASLSNKFTLSKNTNLTTCAFTSDVLWDRLLEVRIRLESSLNRFICLTFFITLLLSLLTMLFLLLGAHKATKLLTPFSNLRGKYSTEIKGNHTETFKQRVKDTQQHSASVAPPECTWVVTETCGMIKISSIKWKPTM